jgi:L-serine dehydratase
MAVSSIFNDVLGPVMRGPSSSHSAAGCRIGLLLRDLINAEITHVEIDYDPNGSLVTTHKSQGTDMGLYGGLLGWEPHDERIPNYKKAIAEANINITVNYIDYGAEHPNNYRIKISNDKISHSFTAISTGGGMIEVLEIDGASVSMFGDYYELLIYTDDPNGVMNRLPENLNSDFILSHSGDRNFIEIKRSTAFSEHEINEISAIEHVNFVRVLKPIIPILSRKNLSVPFIYCDEMLEYAKDKNLSLWELGLIFESSRGNISKDDVLVKMNALIRIMDDSIQLGLKGTEYKDRILHAQSVGFKEKMANKTLLGGELLNTIVLYVTAMMEVKSSMGVIVAAPTAGSCGALPGTLIAAAKCMNKSKDELSKAMLAAGMIGVFISEHSTFSAEVGGCQSECGAGSSMAAAGLVVLSGGSLTQSITAASLALQNSLGMICDPIGNRVEAPCLGRNVLAASNALSCANMALANYDPVVTFDEVVATMFDVGNSMARELRCTSLGGLSITKSAKEIEKRLQKSQEC